jgi:hypothetical protein
MSSESRENAALEERLRASRPLPDARFVDELEERLLPRAPQPRRARARRPVLLAAGGAAALALVVAGLGLAGGGPLAPSGGDGVRAKENCRFVPVRKHVKTPVVVTGRDGQPEVHYRSEVVTRQLKRCR